MSSRGHSHTRAQSCGGVGDCDESLDLHQVDLTHTPPLTQSHSTQDIDQDQDEGGSGRVQLPSVSKQLFDPKDDDDDDDVDDRGLNLHYAPRSNTTRTGHPITHSSLESRPRKLSLDLIAKSALSFSSSLWDRVTDPRLNNSHSIPDDAHASDRSPQSMLHTSTPSVQSALSGPSRWVAQARLWPAEDSDNFIVDEANDGITNGTNGYISASTGSTVPFTLKRILSIIRTCARTATDLDP